MDSVAFNIMGALYAVTAVSVTAAVGATLTVVDDWYRKRQTILTPPDFVFPVAWTIMYTLIAYSLYLAFVGQAPFTVHLIYISNLILNLLWSLIFFKLHKPLTALGEQLLIAGTIVLMMIKVRPYDELAARLLIPYLCWISFASVLNFLVVLKDAEIKDEIRHKRELC